MWSPTRNELFINGCELGDDVDIYLAQAPDFKQTQLVGSANHTNQDTDNRTCYWLAQWSPSGEHILYLTAQPGRAFSVVNRQGINAPAIEGDFQQFDPRQPGGQRTEPRSGKSPTKFRAAERKRCPGRCRYRHQRFIRCLCAL